MQFGMRAHDLGKQGLIPLLETLNNMEIKHTQLAVYKAIDDIDFTIGNFNAGLCHYMATNFKKYDVNIAILGAYINPIHPDQDVIESEVKRFKEYLKYAKLLNAQMVGTETGKLEDWTDVGIEKQYQRLLSTMQRVKYDAERLGVFFAVEGVSKETLHSPELMKRFLDDIDSPNALAIYDPVNLIFPDQASNAEVDRLVDKCFEAYGEKMAIVHLKDFNIIIDENGNKVKVNAEIGKGLMDFERLFYHLKRKKPYITMLLEDSRKERYQSEIDYLQKIYIKA